MEKNCYAIVDLEMCRVPRGPKQKDYHHRSELIQIGAVLLDEGLEIADTFMTHVCPEYGEIDEFIENLTGISPEDVKNAPRAKEALEKFVAWLPDDAIPVSWSDSDENQIRREMEEKGLTIEGLDAYLNRWTDCQETFGRKMGTPRDYALSEALIIADVETEDGEHDALVDARNTARLFKKMQREPEMKLNANYTDPEEVKTVTHNPFAALLAGYNVNK